ncbi:hypothetical protein ANO11243_072820 [Dothideomycetidae sp. 11243]|nr:hypothetical protein ANO11243_072820 [fungal sp. No.11243]
MPSVKSRVFDVTSVAIIGAGPSGLAAARFLLAEQHFKRIDVFEQRSRVGGVWNFNPAVKHVPSDLPLPQVAPATDINAGEGSDEFLSPLYDLLETNIPKDLMRLSDVEWGQDVQLFPKHQTVTELVERYADHVRHLIRFDTRVLHVQSKAADHEVAPGWIVRTRGLDGVEVVQEYDAVIVANGHFNVPHIPDYPGLKDWGSRNPGGVSHSMFYKHPDDYQDKKIVVVGNAPSGIDIANQIKVTCRSPLLHSQRSESFLLSDPEPCRKVMPAIAEFLPGSDRAIRFVDGHIERDIDQVLFCTGYLYSFPFLDVSPPVIDDGVYVKGLWQHLFYRHDPTLAFTVLQQRVIPFPMAEAQAAVLARVWSGRLSLPSEMEMEHWERNLQEETLRDRDFHLLKFPKDADYINAMYDYAMSAQCPKKGKVPPRWSVKEYWIRERFPAIKKAFQDLGEDRYHIRTIEELGFDYEKWKKEEDHGDKLQSDKL